MPGWKPARMSARSCLSRTREDRTAGGRSGAARGARIFTPNLSPAAGRSRPAARASPARRLGRGPFPGRGSDHIPRLRLELSLARGVVAALRRLFESSGQCHHAWPGQDGPARTAPARACTLCDDGHGPARPAHRRRRLAARSQPCLCRTGGGAHRAVISRRRAIDRRGLAQRDAYPVSSCARDGAAARRRTRDGSAGPDRRSSTADPRSPEWSRRDRLPPLVHRSRGDRARSCPLAASGTAGRGCRHPVVAILFRRCRARGGARPGCRR